MASLAGVRLPAQVASEAVREPFKLGTFSHQGRTLVGLVLRDARVVDLAAANASLEQENPSWAKMTMPREMKELIDRYDNLKERLYAIVNKTADSISGSRLPAYVFELKAAKILPPIMYPETMLNAAINYEEHAREAGGLGSVSAAQSTTTASEDTTSAPGIWERKPGDRRQNPYLFLKPRTAVIADGEAIRMPPGRDKLDWECEMAVVMGRRASYVPVERAKDYIFGYTQENDVSDRGGRGDRRHGSDWLVGKAHDTYAPIGPFIVPKEFIADPQNLKIQFTLNGKVMQDANTELMVHNVYELVHYASNILTLQPGDLISSGSPAGTGSGRTPPLFMKAGDLAVCTIEGIGTLTNPITSATPAAASGRQ